MSHVNQIPFLITHEMRRQLAERGYSDKAVDTLTPAAAWKILQSLPPGSVRYRTGEAPAVGDVVSDIPGSTWRVASIDGRRIHAMPALWWRAGQLDLVRRGDP